MCIELSFQRRINLLLLNTSCLRIQVKLIAVECRKKMRTLFGLAVAVEPGDRPCDRPADRTAKDDTDEGKKKAAPPPPKKEKIIENDDETDCIDL